MIHVIHKTAQREGPREEEPRKPQLVQVPEAFRPPLEPKESSVEQARGFHHEPDGYRWSVLDPNISLKPFHVSHDLVHANGNGAHHEGFGAADLVHQNCEQLARLRGAALVGRGQELDL